VSSFTEREVDLPAGGGVLAGTLRLPEHAQGVVLFAHGSGSSRLSPRNRLVAKALADAGFATLLFDLLTAPEAAVDARTAHLRFDIPLLAQRLIAATDWVAGLAETDGLSLGYFGASTGAAAALIAASRRPEVVRAVASRAPTSPGLPCARCERRHSSSSAATTHL
jgi:putative phosphoribosyl transferase